MTTTNSNNMPKYLFTLISEIGDVVCKHAPKEWKSAMIDLNRDMDLGGVFVEFQIQTLTFTGFKEKKLLKDLWEQYGLASVCDLMIEYLDMTDRTYKQFGNNFRLDFDDFNEIKLSKSRNAVRIKTKVENIVKKLRDRQGTKVDLSRTVSLGGYQIVIKDHWTNLKNVLNIPEINQNLTAKFYEGVSVPSAQEIDDKMIPQFRILSSDFTETTARSQTLVSGDVDFTNSFFKTTVRERDLNIRGGVNISGSLETSSTAELRIAIIGSNGTTIVSDDKLGDFPFDPPSVPGLSRVFFDIDITLAISRSIVIYVLKTDGTIVVEARSNDIVITEGEVNSPATSFQTYPILEAIERNLQLILDIQYPLVTVLFGRIGVVYNNNGDTYSSENQERFANLFNGLSARGLVQSDTDNSIAVSFKDLRKAINAFWNIGVSESGGQILIEDRASFFSDTIGTDFTTGDLVGRFNELEIQFEVLPKLAYAKIETGYKSFDYEVINGRGEYNTKNERTSIISGDNTFDNVSPYRGDTMGLSLALNTPIVPNGVSEPSGTNDLKSDKDIFIFKTQQNGDEWDIEQEENIQVVDDTSLFGDTSFNLFFTPTRNLLRHNYEIVTGLSREQNSFLRFQNSEKLQSLKTTDGVTEITENQDILIEDIMPPKWEPGQFIITCPFYEAEIVTLIANKHKLIKLSGTKQGWLLKASYNISKKEIKLFVLQKYFDNPIVIFDITQIDVFDGTIGILNKTKVYIENTGDLDGSQNINIKWLKGSVVKRETDVQKFIAGNSDIFFFDSYTHQAGEAGSDWTIKVTSESSTLTSSTFTVT